MNDEVNEELETEDDEVITDADYEEVGDEELEESDEDEESDEGESQDEEQDTSEPAKTFIPQEVLDQHPEVKNRISADFNRIKELEREIQKRDKKNLEQRREVHTKSKPEIVPKPDKQLAYDDPDEFERQMEAHYQSKESVSKWEQEDQSLVTEEANTEARAAKAEVQAIETLFVENAAKQGITKEQTEKTAGVVVSHIQNMQLSEQDQAKSAQLMRHVMKHPNGAKLLDHLSRKPDELSTLLSLDPIEVGQRLSEINQSFKPKNTKSNAPPPDEPLNSGASTAKDSPFLKGATFT